MEKHNIQIRGAPGSDQKKVPLSVASFFRNLFSSAASKTVFSDPDFLKPDPDPGWFLFVSGYNRDPVPDQGLMTKKILVKKSS